MEFLFCLTSSAHGYDNDDEQGVTNERRKKCFLVVDKK